MNDATGNTNVEETFKKKKKEKPAYFFQFRGTVRRQLKLENRIQFHYFYLEIIRRKRHDSFLDFTQTANSRGLSHVEEFLWYSSRVHKCVTGYVSGNVIEWQTSDISRLIENSSSFQFRGFPFSSSLAHATHVALFHLFSSSPPPPFLSLIA